MIEKKIEATSSMHACCMLHAAIGGSPRAVVENLHITALSQSSDRRSLPTAAFVVATAAVSESVADNTDGWILIIIMSRNGSSRVQISSHRE